MDFNTTAVANVKVVKYINGILTPNNVDKYIPMD